MSHILRTDRVRLNWLAKLYAAKAGARVSGDDLLSEAITRVVAGKRRWPDHLGTMPFLAGIMMSIASELRAKAARDLLDFSTAGIEDAAQAPNPADDETAAALRLVLAKIRTALASEPVLLGLFNLRMRDRPPAEMQAALGLGANGFDRAMRDLKKRLLEIFPEGYPL